ncbi:MAG: hypothetical protein VW270_15565, partial [Candidatus Poseidoniales archaeon]
NVQSSLTSLGGGGLGENDVIKLINTGGGGGGGSGGGSGITLNDVTNLVDSDYVNARVDDNDVADVTRDVLAASPSIIPLDDHQNLGDSDNPWQSLYVSGNTIHLGPLQLKSVQVDGVPQLEVVSESGETAPVDLKQSSLGDMKDVRYVNLDHGDLLYWDSDEGSFLSRDAIVISAITFRGVVDATTDTAPVNFSEGDLYVNSGTGTIHPSWVDLEAGSNVTTGMQIVPNQTLIAGDPDEDGFVEWWITEPSTSGSVMSVRSSTPDITINNTDAANPSIGLARPMSDFLEKDINSSTNMTIRDGASLRIRGHTATSFAIQNSSGQDMFYTTGDDVRLANNTPATGNSILTWAQSDEKYAYKIHGHTDYIEKNINTPTLVTIGDSGSLKFRGNSSTSFALQNNSGEDMLYSIQKDVRLTNNDPTSSTSLLNRDQNDERYALSAHVHDYLKITNTQNTTVTMNSASKLNFKSGHTGTSWALQNTSGQDVLYFTNADLRLANNSANSSNSILNRGQNDNRYATKSHNHSGVYASYSHGHSGYVSTSS